MVATTSHASFRQPNDVSVSLWRYMELSKFVALLQKRSLTFARCDRLGDPFEASIPKGNEALELRAVENLQASIDDAYKMSGRGTPKPGLAEFVAEQQKLLMTSVRLDSRKSHFVSCWHMNEVESAAMWSLYGKSGHSVCIRTDYNTLTKLLSPDHHLGIVRYIDFGKDAIDTSNLFNAMMVKRLSFEHEREARAIIIDQGLYSDDEDRPFILDFAVDITELMKDVYVSPQAPDWFFDVVAGLVAKYALIVNVKRSEMDATPLF